MPIVYVLDQRISTPTHQEAGEVLSLVKITLSCLNPSPQSRPTMKQVSKLLSTQKLHLSKPLHVIITWGIACSASFDHLRIKESGYFR
ncbi:hypothetical protein ACFX12_019692 [Malus domestica]